MVHADKTLQCLECGSEFIFSAGEQEFYASKGLVNEPRRCPACRAARKSRLAGAGGAMDATGVKPERQNYITVCAECGGQAVLPFVPRNDKPVYCSTCFERVRAAVAT